MFVKKVKENRNKRVRKVLQDCNSILDSTMCEINKVSECEHESNIELIDKEEHNVQ